MRAQCWFKAWRRTDIINPWFPIRLAEAGGFPPPPAAAAAPAAVASSLREDFVLNAVGFLSHPKARLLLLSLFSLSFPSIFARTRSLSRFS